MVISFIHQHPITLYLILLVGAAIAEWVLDSRGMVASKRLRNVFYASTGLALALLLASHHVENVPLPILVIPEVKLISNISFDSAEAFCVCMAALYLFAVIVAPKHVVVHTPFPLILLGQSFLLLLAFADSMDTFIVGMAALIYISIVLHRKDSESIRGDVRGEMRLRIFKIYQGVALVLLLISGTMRVLEPLIPSNLSYLLVGFDVIILLVASSLLMGIFPFHSWVVPFVGAPRQTIFLPLISIEVAMLCFFRIYAPLVERFASYTSLFLVLPTLGLLYSAILFFGEDRLKRIPGHLYLSHISLMALSAIGLGREGVTASMLDSVNVMVASAGLLAVCSLLTTRLGIEGILRPRGLAASFPELGVCYLICALSLVGFPGTIGFTEEEVMLGQGVEQHIVLVVIIALGLTLNGFSAFRLFARLFYGQGSAVNDKGLALLPRERAAIIALLGIIIINGMAPSFLVELYKSFAHAGHS